MNKPRIKLDRVDRKILEALQDNARLSSAELADLVALTASPCWRRVKRLEEAGVISAYQARLDARKLGYEVMAFVFITLDKNQTQYIQEFEQAVLGIPQILACHRVSGLVRADDALFLQPFDAAPARRRRQCDEIGQLGARQACIGLQGFQDFPVDPVQFDSWFGHCALS